jgi:hypothetical protein
VVSPGSPVLATRSNPATPPTFTQPYYLNPSVSQQLKLTDRQLAQLREANARFQAHYQNELGRFANLSPTDRQRVLRELEHNYNADNLQAAVTVFTREQASRYRQLELQNRGLGAFTDPPVRRQLNLSSSQVDQLRALDERTQRARQEIDRAAQGNRVEANRRYEVLQRDTENRVNSILNANQRKALQEMIGERFVPPTNSGLSRR